MTEAALSDAAGSRAGRPGTQRDEVRPNSGSASTPPLTQRLGFRLAALLAVALLPLGLISIVQADAWLRSAREQQSAALMGETLRIVAPETGLIREAQGAAAALAGTVRPLVGEEAACDEALSEFAAEFPQYSVVGYIPRAGQMTCAANDAAFDYAGDPVFEAFVANLRPAILVNPRGPVSGTSVVIVAHPVASERGGDELGYVALALPHAALERREATSSSLTGELVPEFVTFNKEGTLLTASTDLAAAPAILPSDIDLLSRAASAPMTFMAETAEGQERFYAMVPLIQGEVFVLGSVPAHEVVQVGPLSLLTPYLLTASMWLGSLAVAWLAAEHLVSRYIRRLGRAIRGFASGSRLVDDLDMAGAPAEIRQVGQAFLRMTDTILHDEAELEDAVHQREVLLREVHHRVKNNLQLIASIMNMQMRRTRSPEAKALMRGLQERVMSLATVHKELYQTSGLTDVRADELLGDITRQIVSMASAPGRTYRISTDFAAVPLTPDQAVPLSLLLTEGLTNAIKYAEPEPGEPSPRLTLRFTTLPDGRAELAIANSASDAVAETPSGDGTGLGRQLVAAFASQIGGEVTSGVVDGRYELRVAFELSPPRSEAGALSVP